MFLRRDLDLEAAVAILIRERHRDFSNWTIDEIPGKDGPERVAKADNFGAGWSFIYEFEAIAIAERYEKIHALNNPISVSA